MRLRCPQCQTVVTVSDTLPPEALPTHCSRCAVNRALGGVDAPAAPPRLEPEPVSATAAPPAPPAMAAAHDEGTASSHHVRFFGAEPRPREAQGLVRCEGCGTNWVANSSDIARRELFQCTRCGRSFRPQGPGFTPGVRCPRCEGWAVWHPGEEPLRCGACGHTFRPSTPTPPGAPMGQPEAAAPVPTISASAPPATMVFGALASGLRRAGVPLRPPTPGGPRAWLECRACYTTYAVQPEVLETEAEVQCSRCGNRFTARRPLPSLPGAAPVPAPPTRARVVPEPPPPRHSPRDPPFRQRADFIGVTAFRAGTQLHQCGRRLPLDVWLRLADSVMGTLERVEVADPLWARWVGPESFGVDLEGDFVMFDEPRTGPSPDWVHPDLWFQNQGELAERGRVWSVCRTLVWLLDPFPTSRDRHHLRLERVFAHPQLPDALHDVLDRGLGMKGATTVAALRSQVATASGLSPASKERVQGVFFAVGLEAPRQEDLPPQWLNGALEVHLDAVLERCVPLEQCPPDPRAVETFGRPLLPTRTLRLVLTREGRPLRAVPISAEKGLPDTVALPVGSTLKAGQRIDLELHHPEQPAFRVQFEGVVGADRFVTLRIEPHTRGELDVLLSSLAVDAPAPRLVPRREPVPGLPRSFPEPRPDSRARDLGCLLVAGGVLTLPVTVIAGALAWFDVISSRAVLWTSGLTFVAVMLGMVWTSTLEREGPDPE